MTSTAQATSTRVLIKAHGGLVFALLPGGACRGVVYRLRPEHGEREIERLMALARSHGLA